MPQLKQGVVVFVLLLFAALSLRTALARFLPVEEGYDSRVYNQIASNLVQHKVYSHATEPPFDASLIRVPGYPLFLAGTYALFGHGDTTSVRIAQALIDTATCGLVALIAFYWEPDPGRKRAAAIGALTLAAFCPFTVIYVTTILTETITTFLITAMCLTATLAFRARKERSAIQWWLASGLLGGLAVMVRPDSALFVAAIGLTLVSSVLFLGSESHQTVIGKHDTIFRVSRAAFLGALFTLAFCVVLVPWTLRNWRVFKVFQPLAPVYASMPGEFVPRGYYQWLRTWLHDERDVETMIGSLDSLPIEINDIPANAFDSEDEKRRVTALLLRYNSPSPSTVPMEVPSEPEDEGEVGMEPESGSEPDAELAPSRAAMTPAIDAAFAQLARERKSRSPFRYYVELPVKRVVGMWFNTHSQYYPFEGELFADDDLARTTSQQVWLPIFTALVWIYSFLGVVGCWYLWQARDVAGRRWLLLAVLVIFLRLLFFGYREDPEPRYMMELFPTVSILGGIALVRVIASFQPKTS